MQGSCVPTDLQPYRGGEKPAKTIQKELAVQSNSKRHPAVRAKTRLLALLPLLALLALLALLWVERRLPALLSKSSGRAVTCSFGWDNCDLCEENALLIQTRQSWDRMMDSESEMASVHLLVQIHGFARSVSKTIKLTAAHDVVMTLCRRW